MKIDIGISQEARKKIVERLAVVLADTYTLYLKTHGFHWNVTGPLFSTLHLLFESNYQELAIAVDVLAERIRTLGFPAPASFSQYTTLSNIQEETTVPEALQMVRQLVIGHETVARTIRESFDCVEEAHDEATADLLTQRLNIHEKTAWMLRSLLE